MYRLLFDKCVSLAVLTFSVAICLAFITHEPPGRTSLMQAVGSKVSGMTRHQAPAVRNPNAPPPLSQIKKGGLGVYAKTEPKTLIGRVKRTLGIYQNQIDEQYKNAYKAIDETPPPPEEDPGT